MATESAPECPVCSADVLPGTLFCWQHVSDAPRVGEYRDDHGQLLWVTRRCKVLAERAVAVRVNGRQVVVRSVDEMRDQRPAKLRIHYADAGPSGRQEESVADVPLATLFEGFTAGLELVDATRASA